MLNERNNLTTRGDTDKRSSMISVCLKDQQSSKYGNGARSQSWYKKQAKTCNPFMVKNYRFKAKLKCCWWSPKQNEYNIAYSIQV